MHTISDLLPTIAPLSLNQECLAVLASSAQLRADWWTRDGVLLSQAACFEHPGLSDLISIAARHNWALRRPYAIPVLAGGFAVQVYSASPWQAYYYRVLSVGAKRYRVHYLHPAGNGTFTEVTGRLPPGVASWIDAAGDNPRGPVGLVEKDALRPVAMRSLLGRWKPVLGKEDMQVAYTPNLQHGIQQSSKPHIRTKEVYGGANIIYTDGSGQLDGIGWGVSAAVDQHRIIMAGGWKRPHCPGRRAGRNAS
ncbi:MAG: hypothetical protein Q8R28_19500, partial [Dehalococcoidia bacterium]|nr:hypothetical protein [Dehalococcoidia bacterium]